jgi:hypothetical protein
MAILSVPFGQQRLDEAIACREPGRAVYCRVFQVLPLTRQTETTNIRIHMTPSPFHCLLRAAVVAFGLLAGGGLMVATSATPYPPDLDEAAVREVVSRANLDRPRLLLGPHQVHSLRERSETCSVVYMRPSIQVRRSLTIASTSERSNSMSSVETCGWAPSET